VVTDGTKITELQKAYTGDAATATSYGKQMCGKKLCFNTIKMCMAIADTTNYFKKNFCVGSQRITGAMELTVSAATAQAYVKNAKVIKGVANGIAATVGCSATWVKVVLSVKARRLEVAEQGYFPLDDIDKDASLHAGRRLSTAKVNAAYTIHVPNQATTNAGTSISADQISSTLKAASPTKLANNINHETTQVYEKAGGTNNPYTGVTASKATAVVAPKQTATGLPITTTPHTTGAHRNIRW